MNPCRREAQAAHSYDNIGGVMNFQDKQGMICHKVVGGVNEANIFNEEHPNVNPRTSEALVTHFYNNNGGVLNSQVRQGMVSHKVVGGVIEANIFNEEHPNVNPRRSEADATHFYSNNDGGGVAQRRKSKQKLTWGGALMTVVQGFQVGGSVGQAQQL